MVPLTDPTPFTPQGHGTSRECSRARQAVPQRAGEHEARGARCHKGSAETAMPPDQANAATENAGKARYDTAVRCLDPP